MLKGLEGSFAAFGNGGLVRAVNVPESAGRGGEVTRNTHLCNLGVTRFSRVLNAH